MLYIFGISISSPTIVFVVGGKNTQLNNALYLHFILLLAVQCTIMSKIIWVK